MHRSLLHNDDIVDAHQNTLSAGQVGLLNGWGVFTTMRVAEGVLFAFERHWDRMQRDAAKLHVPFPADPAWLKTRLLRLVEANSAFDATLRVAIVRNRGGLYEGPDLTRAFDLIAFTTGRNDWGSSARLAVKPHGRHAQSEFAGTKMLSWAQNLTWYEEAHQRGFDEVVLLNERGEVSQYLRRAWPRCLDPPAQLGLSAWRHSRGIARRDPASRSFGFRENTAARRLGESRPGFY
jgi:branched-chain amino acid aminotransferase